MLCWRRMEPSDTSPRWRVEFTVAGRPERHVGVAIRIQADRMRLAVRQPVEAGATITGTVESDGGAPRPFRGIVRRLHTASNPFFRGGLAELELDLLTEEFK